MKLSRKSENAVANDRVLKFFFDDKTQHIEAVVQASMRNMSYTVKVYYRHYMLQSALFARVYIQNCGLMNIFTRVYDGVMLYRRNVPHRSTGKTDLIKVGFRVRFWVA